MILVDGREESSVPVDDRGFQYGDGVFETLAVDDARPLALRRHLDRLIEGCRRLAIPPPPRELLAEESAHVCAGARRAVLKVIVTRGRGGRGYRAPAHAEPTRVVVLHAWPDYPSRARHTGVAVRMCRTRLARNRALAGIKHMNRLEQILARAEHPEADVADGLMLDDRGNVIESTACNLFVRHDRVLRTPDLSECGVAGIVRGLVVETARGMDDVEVRVAPVRAEELATADECFLSNSLVGIWPVSRLEDREMRTDGVAPRVLERLIAREVVTRD